MVSLSELIWLVIADSVAWAVLHLGVAWLGTQLPAEWFAPQSALFRARPWERSGKRYESVFRVKSWKHLLPDGAAWFRGGFQKGALSGRDPAYLRRFARETCRGEAVHWVVLASSGLFFLWNPWWLGICMVLYAVTANAPCIVAQRYNRARLTEVLARR